MRVNPNDMPDMLFALATTQKQEDRALLQMSTGRRVNRPSEDPSASARVVLNHDQSSQIDTFQKSISSISGEFQMADSALASVVTSLQRAITLGIQASNTATVSAADRSAVVAELRGVQSELISLANTSYQGRFIFAGSQNTQPFVADLTTTSGVRYDGDGGTNTVDIGNGYPLQVNLPGSQLFTAAGVDVFQAIHDLRQSVENNTGIDTALTSVRAAFDHVVSQRTFYGNALDQTESQTNYLSGEKLQLSSQENDLVGADAIEAASNLVNAQNARNATLSAISRRGASTLFDFLR